MLNENSSFGNLYNELSFPNNRKLRTKLAIGLLSIVRAQMFVIQNSTFNI